MTRQAISCRRPGSGILPKEPSVKLTPVACCYPHRLVHLHPRQESVLQKMESNTESHNWSTCRDWETVGSLGAKWCHSRYTISSPSSENLSEEGAEKSLAPEGRQRISLFQIHQGSCIYKLTEVRACVRPAQLKPKRNCRVKNGGGHKVPPLAQELLGTERGKVSFL